MAARIAMMAITTKSSMRVKAQSFRGKSRNPRVLLLMALMLISSLSGPAPLSTHIGRTQMIS
jgi:hypothetical protein